MENPLDDLERIRSITDPGERAIELGKVLNALPAISTEISAERQAALQEMRANGMSLAEIAAEVGLHRNRVQNIIAGT